MYSSTGLNGNMTTPISYPSLAEYDLQTFQLKELA